MDLVMCNKSPGKSNGIFFEVITKRKIAKHLKKGVMTGSVTDVFQVVVFTAGPDTALRGYSAYIVTMFLTHEDTFELVHTRIGKEQGRVIMRDQG